ncbi:hypothetical protein DMA11_09495 [Marinilabiliaceae bacterium JC017]|nr:hypothetical protein DMA11_09495 [Marinilabiliaceae bacterium JC017]
MGNGKQMTAEELHFLGIKVVYKYMVDEGYEILNVRKEPDVNPQILAMKEGNRILVVVRTASYPDMGILLPHIASDVLTIAAKNKATCYFASVGIANANGDSEEEMSKPEVDGEYYINFKGLQDFPRF